MVSRTLQQQLQPPGGSMLCGAMREAILRLCRDNVAYGGQVEVDGIICITGQQHGQQIVVKVHELLHSEKWPDTHTKDSREPGLGHSSTPSHEEQQDWSRDQSEPSKSPAEVRMEHPFPAQASERGPDTEQEETETRQQEKVKDSEQEADRKYAEGRLLKEESEALDLRVDSPAGKIKQEPMDYEETQLHHPYGSSHRHGTQDAGQHESSADRHLAADVGSGRESLSAAHTPLIVPFLAQHPDMPESSFSAGPSPSPYMDSRLRHLLAKMPYTKPHPAMTYLQRRPLFPNMSVLQSGAPECKSCGFTFAQVELLKEHNEAVHAVFTCSVCYRTFTSRSNLDRHSRLHTGHKPYICVKCGKAFSRKDHLTNHSAKHAFKCGKCLKRFVERDALQGHYEQDHQVSLTNICEHCNKGFSDPAVFTEHLKSHPEYLGGAKIHPKHKPFACTECNYVCGDKLQLLKHSQVHGESSKNLVYTCLACADSFGDPLIYSQHFESHQDLSDIFECCICRKICRTWRELKQHEQSHLHVSSRGPTLACPVCYVIFDDQDVLAEHLQSHDQTSMGGFPCNVCNEVFPSLEALQKHEQDEKHYVKKAFMSPQRSHTPPRATSPFDCNSPRGVSSERAYVSSDSESEDSEEELDVIAVDEPPPVPGKHTEQEKKGHFVKDFVITENPTPIIEISGTSDVDMKSSSLTREPSTSTAPLPAVTTPETPQPGSPQSPPPPKPSLPPLPLSSMVTGNLTRQPSPDAPQSEPSWLPPHLQNHNNTSYTYPAPPLDFPCNMCDVKLLSFHDFENHCVSDHFRYPCMYCTKTFAQKANRDRHLCIHTGEKPYTCPECDQKFARGDKLKIHRMKWHNVQFPPSYGRSREGSTTDWTSSSSEAISVAQGHSQSHGSATAVTMAE